MLSGETKTIAPWSLLLAYGLATLLIGRLGSSEATYMVSDCLSKITGLLITNSSKCSSEVQENPVDSSSLRSFPSTNLFKCCSINCASSGDISFLLIWKLCCHELIKGKVEVESNES
uniref:Uncharacterized protein n=1 Tax=Opuntia streptacantha TaxID=393608 RepID=A0A7C9CRY9_OPUST